MFQMNYIYMFQMTFVVTFDDLWCFRWPSSNPLNGSVKP